MPGKVDIIFNAQTEAASRKINGFLGQLQNGLNGIQGALRTGLGIDVARRLVDALAAIPRQLDSAIKRGVSFNSTLENSRLGIAAVVKQFNQRLTFDEALKQADDALAALTEKAAKSPSTLRELVAAFQGISGAASAANIPLKQQVDLVVLMSQALAGLGIRSEQILQESRALLTGNINEDAAAAKLLGITRAQVMAMREQGKLYEFLTEKLSAFAEAGERGTQTLTTRFGNLADILDQRLGVLTVGVFERIKKGLGSLTDLIARPEFATQLAATAGNITDLVSGFFSLATTGVAHIGAVVSALETLALAIAVVTAAWLAMKAVGVAQIIAAWVTPIGVATAATWGLNAAAVSLTRMLTSLKGAVTLAGAAFAGWEIGKFLSEFDLKLGNVNLKVKQWVQLASVEFLKGINRFQHAIGLIELDELTRRMAALDATSRELQGITEPEARKAPEAPENKPFKWQPSEAEKRLLESSDKLALARAKSAADVAAAARALELKELEDQSLEEERLVGESAERKKKLIQEVLASALLAPQLQLDAIDAQLSRLPQGDKATTDDNAKRKELLAAREELATQMVQLELQARQESLAVDQEYNEAVIKAFADAERRKKEIEDEFEAERRKRDTAARAQAEITYSELEGRIRQVETEPDIGRIDRKRRLLPLLREETRLIEEQLEINRQRVNDPSLNEEARIEAARRLVELEQQRADVMRKTKDLEADNFLGALRRNLRALSDEWSAVGQNIAGVLTGGIKSAVDGVSQGIMGMIDGTVTWGQVFANVARSIISSLINVVVQWIAQMTLMRALQAIFGATAVLQAAGMAAAWAPAAVAANTATFGAAGSVGLTSTIIQMATGQSVGAAMSLATLPGRASGGPMEVGQPYIVGEFGPEIVRPRVPMMATSNRDSRGQLGPANVRVVVVNDSVSAVKRAVAEGQLSGEIVQVIHLNKLQLGIPS